MKFFLSTKNKCWYFSLLLYISFIVLCLSCNKLVTVPQPISSVTSETTFSTDATATSAMLGIYSNMSLNQNFPEAQTTFFSGMSSDELSNQIPGDEFQDFTKTLTNSLTAILSSNPVSLTIWKPAYFNIYSANSIILGVQSSKSMTTATKNQLTGEAKFIRAYCYFYLTNFFGDVPIVLTTDFNQTVLLPKSPTAQVYQQIIGDLQDAQKLMIGDFSLTGGQPIRANKWAATALLARAYLYEPAPNYASSDSAASAVINSAQFSLESDLNNVFLATSKEAILELQSNVIQYPFTTQEGNFFLPVFNSFLNLNINPKCWLTNQMLGAFEPNDLRKVNWLDSAYVFDNTGNPTIGVLCPYKYKIFQGAAGVQSSENFVMLRLAEQYLIRAEAEANLAQLAPAINDLNMIRTRAGLPNFPATMTQDSVLNAVRQEYRVEFFAEGGHRWFDLKRWGIALQTLDTISYKRAIDSTQLLYPIPVSEIQADPNLKQNSGY